MSATTFYENERVKRIFEKSKEEDEDEVERYFRALHETDNDTERSAFIARIARNIHKKGIAYPSTDYGYADMSKERIMHRIAVHSDLANENNWRNYDEKEHHYEALGGIVFTEFKPTTLDKARLTKEIVNAKANLDRLLRLRDYHNSTK